MKRLMAIAIAMLAVAGILSTRSAEASSFTPAHFQPVQYSFQPATKMVCYVNGVDYPVDYANEIWAFNGYWFVIGRIMFTPYGTIAVRNDGVRFPAVC